MCRKKDIEIDSVLTDLELAAKKAKAIIEDLKQDYFEESTIGKADAWKIVGVYYEDARLRAQIVNDYLYEVLGEISSLQKLALGQEEEGGLPNDKEKCNSESERSQNSHQILNQR